MKTTNQVQRVETLVYIVASSKLAGAYLVQVLSGDATIGAISCEQLPGPPLKSKTMVFVLDNSFAPLPCNESLRLLRDLYPLGRFIVVGDRVADDKLGWLLQAGAHGFVEYTSVVLSLAEAIHAVCRGQMWVSGGMISKIFEPAAIIPRIPTRLTRRESQVADLVQHRLSNKEIGSILGISECTVKYHLTSIFGKLHATRQDLMRPDTPLKIWCQLLDLAGNRTA